MTPMYIVNSVATWLPKNKMQAEIIESVRKLDGLTIKDNDELKEFARALNDIAADAHAAYPKCKAVEVSSISSATEHIYSFRGVGVSDICVCDITVRRIAGEWKGGTR